MTRHLPGDSIRFRLIGLGALLITAALIAGYLAISAILEDFITGRFDAESRAVAEGFIANAALTETGDLDVTRAPVDPRYNLPLSGWYWQISGDGQGLVKSLSLLERGLNDPAANANGLAATGPDGQSLRLTRIGFTLPDSDAQFVITVSAPQATVDQALAAVRRPLAVSLVVLGLVLALASVLQVTAGLKSLTRLQGDIRRIRAGKAESLPLPPVAELRPIAREINGLLEQNRAVLARSRDHVGNLAHSLKTPLAALANGLGTDHPGQALIARMDRQIGWHLRRARSSVAARVLGQRTPVGGVIDDILLVLRRPIDEAGLAVTTTCPPGLSFAGERQDLEEMIGNLAENAVKWAIGKVDITAKPATTGASPELQIRIEDDGPGMSDQDHAQALSRGARLDETGPPGSGLGLAIVADLAALHGGKLELERADLGGLRVVLTLPA